jgi:glutamate N-acetyltransferase/amino-acid N-acetyltransferase
MTTDTRPKQIALEFDLDDKKVKIGGMCKGAGMINPNLATMLAFITSDASIDQKALKEALKNAVEKSFNLMAVDTDMSTNDTILILANGLAGNKKIVAGTKDLKKFQSALDRVCIYLAKEIARDGEGATKLIEVKVKGAKNEGDARKVAKALVVSNLLKAAVFGRDPNWGRIMCATGYSGAEIDPDKISAYIGKEPLVKNGMGYPFNIDKIRKLMSRKKVFFTVDLGMGKSSVTAWGCDLTYDYVKVNARYHT